MKYFFTINTYTPSTPATNTSTNTNQTPAGNTSKGVINVDTAADITLEKGLFTNRANFFEEVFGVKPVIRQKKLL